MIIYFLFISIFTVGGSRIIKDDRNDVILPLKILFGLNTFFFLCVWGAQRSGGVREYTDTEPGLFLGPVSDISSKFWDLSVTVVQNSGACQ
jgi:hypothetical protein